MLDTEVEVMSTNSSSKNGDDDLSMMPSLEKDPIQAIRKMVDLILDKKMNYPIANDNSVIGATADGDDDADTDNIDDADGVNTSNPSALKQGILQKALRNYLIVLKTKRRDLLKHRILLCGACVMHGIKEVNLDIQMKELIQVLSFDKTLFNKMYRNLVELCPKLDSRKIHSGAKYLKRWAQNLGLSDETLKRAKEILNYVEKNGKTKCRRPSTVAAGVIYKACLVTGERRSFDDIATVAHIDASTIRSVVALFDR